MSDTGADNQQTDAAARRLRSLIEQTSDPVFCYECDPPFPIDLPIEEQVKRLYGCVLAECNDVCARSYGAQSATEVVGRKLTELFGTRVGSLDKLFTEMIRNGYRTVDGEGVEVLPDGSKRYFLNNGHGVIEDGKLLRVWGTYRDITERKRAEEALRESEAKYRQVVSNTSEAIAMVDAKTRRLTEVNDAAMRMYGYTHEELLGLRYSDITAEPEDSEVEIRRMLTSEPSVRIQRRYHKKKDGTIFPVEISASLLELADRTLLYGIVRDLTEQRQLQEERERIEKLRSIGVLAGGIAHDFNNILSGILGNLSLLRLEAEPTGDALLWLDDAVQACRQATDLTKQLLTFSRGGDPVRKPADISDLLRTATSFALRGSRVSPAFDIADDLCPVEVDTGQLSQVVNNLVINARQAMPTGGTLRVRAANVAEPGDASLAGRSHGYVCVTVEDHGIGIAANLLDKIFDPYFTTKGEGSGLGLAVTHSIIQKHGGHISVESEPGRGTKFHIYLPALEAREIEPAAIAQGLRYGTGRILLMDDESLVRNVTGEMLQALGYTVVTAEDGAEAVVQYNRAAQAGEPFAAAILDLTVPGGDGGASAVRAILASDPAARCIASSGYSNDPVIAEYARHGFCAAISKPYDLDSLGAVLHQVVSAAKLP